MEDEARLIPLSALQHYLYCSRQCALIHLERQWAENRYTAEGRILHERADPGGELTAIEDFAPLLPDPLQGGRQPRIRDKSVN